MTTQFIQRPILSLIISILITFVGLLAIVQLPMTQFPNIAPTEVTVTTKYTGANAVTCTKAVVTPLERAINGVPGMAYMSSVSGNDGTSVIQIIFKVGTDPEVASVNVQNRVAAVLDELPEEVIKSGVIVEKVVSSMLMYINVLSTDPELDEKFLYNFSDINLLAELKRIDGVGFADIMGSREYSMRVWLKPDRMVAYNISAAEIIEALQNQNIEAAPGKVGESSDKMAQSLQYVIRYTGKFNTKEQYEDIALKSDVNGKILRLKDVAEVEFGSQDYDVLSKENGRPSAAIMLKQRSGSNARKVINDIKAKMEEIKQTSFPAGMDYTISYDVARFLDASIDEVIKTLIEAFLLVSLVVYIFLQDWRSTLIPAIAVPVSLIGTFFFMLMFGFSLNLITLFALVLAIGIVVDNAIVVVEAVHAKMEKTNISPMMATEAAMKEISGAIVAITLVMSAVFVPVAFMSGPTGIFYRQFSLTMAVSIVLSGVVALTLTPALCAIILKNTHNKPKKQTIINRLLGGFNRWYDTLADKYQNILKSIVSRKSVTYILLLIFCIGSGLLGRIIPFGFIPNEDQGTFYASVTTPAGATLERTSAVVDEIERVASTLESTASVSTLAGFNLLTDGTGSTYGMCMVNLKPWSDRKESVDEVIDQLREKTSHIKDATIEFFPPPAVPGYGNASGFELRLLDKSRSDDLNQLEQVVDDFVVALNERPEIQNTFTSFDASFPQYLIHVDNDKATQKGVTIGNALENLQALIGSYYATNFIRFGQLYKVMVQALPQYRAKPEDILKLQVENEEGESVPYSSFITIEKVSGPEQLTRYNMFTSAMINGENAPGYSSGDAIRAIQEVAKEKLPRGFDIDWAGISRDEVLAGNEAIYIFIICLLFVYFLLSAQYESFLLPLPVILSLPTGVFGAFFLLMILGLENNIYAQVAMIMLIGLLGKNAILIVEFASMRHRDGKTPVQAAIEGAKVRLRPILMTSFAFIAGLLPLMFASGAGAIGNRTIGTAAAGGMLFGTIFGVIIIPGLYVIFATIAEKYNTQHHLNEELPYTETI
jgi:hydrophobic/amphiphilic exporter-1 (mainly G- bacteria), HAE1 family